MRVAVTALAMLVAACAAWGGCADTDLPEGTPVETSGVEREIRDFNLVETKDGRRSWNLHSETAWRLPSQSRVRLEDVELVFFDQQGEVKSRLTARRGEVDEDSGNMTARGRVKVITSELDTLLTEELNYDQNIDRISGPGFVRLSSPDRVLTGIGYEADPDLTNYKVFEDVEIIVVDRERAIDAGE